MVTIYEETSRGERPYDVWSRLLQNKGHYIQAGEFGWVQLQLSAEIGYVAVWPKDGASYLPVGGLQQVFGQMTAYKSRNAGDECLQSALQRLEP